MGRRYFSGSAASAARTLSLRSLITRRIHSLHRFGFRCRALGRLVAQAQFAMAAPSQEIDAVIARNAHYPRRKRLRRVVPVEAAIGAHECVLRRVFSEHGASEQPKTQTEHSAVATAVFRFEIDLQPVPCAART